MDKIVLISGHIGTGKTKLCNKLEEDFNFRIIRSKDILRRHAEEKGLNNDRLSLQKLGDKLDKETKGAWLLDEILKNPENKKIKYLAIDSVRILNQIKRFREKFALGVIHAHLTAPKSELEKRFNARKKRATKLIRN